MRQRSPVSEDRMVLVVVVGVCPDGVAILQLLMAMTQLVFFGKSFTVFVPEELFTMTFRLMQFSVGSRCSCIYSGNKMVAGEVDPNWRLLSNVM